VGSDALDGDAADLILARAASDETAQLAFGCPECAEREFGDDE
jgi:hypothetical protein